MCCFKGLTELSLQFLLPFNAICSDWRVFLIIILSYIGCLVFPLLILLVALDPIDKITIRNNPIRGFQASGSSLSFLNTKIDFNARFWKLVVQTWKARCSPLVLYLHVQLCLLKMMCFLFLKVTHLLILCIVWAIIDR